MRFCKNVWGGGIALLVFYFAMAGTVEACPLCNTDTGKQVREGIFGEDFAPNLLAIVAPFPFMLAAAWFVVNQLGKEDKSYGKRR
ncbi:MAG: hypothetical protein ACO1QB_02510 [Verrucomicrobiales bacterium]